MAMEIGILVTGNTMPGMGWVNFNSPVPLMLVTGNKDLYVKPTQTLRRTTQQASQRTAEHKNSECTVT